MTKKSRNTELETLRARLVLISMGLAGALALAALGVLVYTLFTAQLVTLRWWAGLATVIALFAPVAAYFLGMSSATAHREGLRDGLSIAQTGIQHGVQTTMHAASETAQIRVNTAGQLRQAQRGVDPVALANLLLERQPPALDVDYEPARPARLINTEGIDTF